MDRREFLRLASVGFVAGMMPLKALAQDSAENERLNVLLITADDLGLQCGCYGEELIETPGIDGLAGGGVRFEIAYVAQASCSPSRSAMFTGLYPHSNGQYGLTGFGCELHEEIRANTIPNILRRAGYRTGIIGKLHVGPERSFEFEFANMNIGMTRRVREVATWAERFLDTTKGRRWFLMVNYSDPHAVKDSKNPRVWGFPGQIDGLPEKLMEPSEKTLFAWQGIDNEVQRVRTAGYYDAVKRLDAGVGMLMEVLEKRGLAKNTLVIFVGDHGPPFDRSKTTVYEAGLRIPFIVRWPGVAKAGARKQMVSTVDILPTILDATGVSERPKMQGRSLRGPCADEGAPWREYLLAEFHFHGRRPYYPRRAVRDERWKLIHNLLGRKATPPTGVDYDLAHQAVQERKYNGTAVRRAFETYMNPPEWELYDLENDPIEFVNLAGKEEYKETLERMKGAMRKVRKETEDPFLDEAFVEKIGRM